jgi:transposase
LIFLDESGVTTSMTRIYGRRADGRRIHETTPGAHWKIRTILGAMRLSGITAAMTIEEATDADIFLTYVEQILCPTLQPGDVVVMDNLSSHKVNGVSQLIAARGASVLYLPPYSPDLNPSKRLGPRSSNICAPRVLDAKRTSTRPSPKPSNSSRPTMQKHGSDTLRHHYRNYENALEHGLIRTKE